MKKYIMIVEDDINISTVISIMLGRGGHDTKVFNNGTDSIVHYKTNNADIIMVISDLSMPVMTGIDVVREILAINPDAKILIVTGSIKDNIKHFVKYPNVDILSKPFGVVDLNNKIVEMLNKVV